MGELGIPELLIILAIVLVLFGPSKIAGLGKSLGQGIREFRQSVRDGSTSEAEVSASALGEPVAVEATPRPPAASEGLVEEGMLR